MERDVDHPQRQIARKYRVKNVRRGCSGITESEGVCCVQLFVTYPDLGILIAGLKG